MAIEYRGDEFLYLVEVEDDDGESVRRFFNQTDGSSSISSDDIELETKDKTGSDYGSVTEELSIEGVMTKDDSAIKYIRKSIRNKKLVRIITVNTRDLSTEEGLYKIDDFEQTNATGEYAEYSIDATLNGDIKEDELEELPDGAPANDGEEEKDNEGDE